MENTYLIKGVVEQLSINNAYQNTVMSDDARTAKGVAAVGAAAVGEAVASTVLATGDTGYEVDYFSCVVDGKQLEGAFYKVEFKEGDVIEFAIEEITEHQYLVLAARDTEKRILWLPLHQDKGTSIYKKHSVIESFQNAFYGAMLVNFILLFFLPKDDKLLLLFFFFSVLLASFLFVVPILLSVSWTFYKFSVAATEAFRILGYENPEWVDVAKVSDDITKEMNKKERAATGRFAPRLEPWSYRY